MAVRVDIPLEQCWDTLDEAIDYFLELVLDLKAYKRHPELPTDLFFHIETGDTKLNEKVTEANSGITLESL